MSSKTANTTAKAPISKNGSRGAKKSIPDKLEPGFKVDRSRAARSMSKAYAMAQNRSQGEKPGKPSVQIVTVAELNTLERDTSETAKAVLKVMRKTHQKLYGGKAKVKSA